MSRKAPTPARSLLRKSPLDRSTGDLRVLNAWLQQTAPSLLSGLPDEAQRDVCKHIGLQAMAPNSIIFKQDTIGMDYYWILTGSVEVYKLDHPEMLDDMLEGGLFYGAALLDRAVEGLRLVATLEAGLGFGELALVTDQRRAQMVVASDNVELLVLAKDVFARTLWQVHGSSKILRRKFNFLQSIPLFRSWQSSKLMSLAYCLQLHRAPKNTLLFKAGQSATRIYFVVKGSVKLLRTLERRLPGGERRYATVELAVISKRDILADSDVLLRRSPSNHLSSALCGEQTTLYAMERVEFEHFMYGEEKPRLLLSRLASLRQAWESSRLALAEAYPQLAVQVTPRIMFMSHYSVASALARPTRYDHPAIDYSRLRLVPTKSKASIAASPIRRRRRQKRRLLAAADDASERKSPSAASRAAAAEEEDGDSDGDTPVRISPAILRRTRSKRTAGRSRSAGKGSKRKPLLGRRAWRQPGRADMGVLTVDEEAVAAAGRAEGVPAVMHSRPKSAQRRRPPPLNLSASKALAPSPKPPPATTRPRPSSSPRKRRLL
eukprot:PLAT1380.1.p1 GENE.PLAT1380.1~~PLAT1380.1.p1  ORF type:complete len:548 (-),score=145.46 PLAT1380.1:47-1690(-)